MAAIRAYVSGMHRHRRRRVDLIVVSLSRRTTILVLRFGEAHVDVFTVQTIFIVLASLLVTGWRPQKCGNRDCASARVVLAWRRRYDDDVGPCPSPSQLPATGCKAGANAVVNGEADDVY